MPPTPHRDLSVATRAAFGGMVLLLSLLFVPLPHPLNTPLVRYASDWAHIPLYAAAFLTTRVFLKPRFPRAELLAATLGIAAGGLSEILQSLTSREPSVGDFVFNLLGIALAWAGVSCWRRRGVWRMAHAVLLAGCVATAGFSVGRKAAEIRDLDAMTPLLAGFERPNELDRWEAKAGTQMRRTAPGHAKSGWALGVRCSATEAWPGVSMEDFESDWRGYRWLEWSVHVASGEPLDLAVRIDDDQGAAHGTRYTAYVPTVPSQEVYRIDLREVAAHFREHPMNMARVTELHFFLDEPRTDRAFSLDEVRLIP